MTLNLCESFLVADALYWIRDELAPRAWAEAIQNRSELFTVLSVVSLPHIVAADDSINRSGYSQSDARRLLIVAHQQQIIHQRDGIPRLGVEDPKAGEFIGRGARRLQ